MKNKAAQADSPVWFDGKNINEALVSSNINGIIADSLRTYVQD